MRDVKTGEEIGGVVLCKLILSCEISAVVLFGFDLLLTSSSGAATRQHGLVCGR